MSPFKYRNIHSYLNFLISEMPKKGRGERTKLAAFLGVSTTFVSQALSGEKPFTSEQTLKLAQYFGLNGIESDYLHVLNQYERASSTDLKKYLESKLEELHEKSLNLVNRVQAKKNLNDREKAVFYSSPLYSAIRLYTSTNDKGKTLADIVERFELSRAKAAEILNFLIECGLCVEKNDRYTMGVQSTHIEKGSPHLIRHHSNWRLRALQYSEMMTNEELMYTAPVSLSKNDFNLLREEMVLFIKKFLETVHESPGEEIACINLDWFWIKK